MGEIPVMFESRSVKPAFGRLSLVPRPRPAQVVARPAAVVIIVRLEILWIILPYRH